MTIQEHIESMIPTPRAVVESINQQVNQLEKSMKTNESIKEICERSIILAADGVEKLRAPDVMRVMEDFFYGCGSTSEMVDYIIANRPDLADEAKACQLEIVPAT